MDTSVQYIHLAKYIMYNVNCCTMCHVKLTRTFLLRSKHQLSSNASILARSASITGEAAGGVPGDSSEECDDEDSCCAGVLPVATAAELISKIAAQNRMSIITYIAQEAKFCDFCNIYMHDPFYMT